MATVSKQLNNLVRDKRTLVRVLNSKEVESTDDETYTSLSEDVEDIISPTPKIKNVKYSHRNYLWAPEFVESLPRGLFLDEAIVDCNNLFAGFSNLTSLDLSVFSTSNVTNMRKMFCICSKLTSLDLSTFNTSKVTNMASMFLECRELETLNLSVGTFTTSNVTNVSGMFYNCSKLNVSNLLPLFDFNKVTDFSRFLSGVHSLTSVDLSTWNFNTTSNINFEGVFRYCPNLTSVIFGNSNLSRFTDIGNLFYTDSRLTSVDLSNVVAPINPIYTYSAFYDCTNITTINFGNSSWVLSTASSMFYGCSYLTSLDLSKFSINPMGSSISLERMFYGCRSVTSLGLPNDFVTSAVSSMKEMFTGCNNLLSLDVSNYDTSKVTNMDNLFDGCTKLTTLDLRNWDLSKIYYAVPTFKECHALVDLKFGANYKFSSSVTSLAGMFYYCDSLPSLDLSSFNTSNITSMSYMFQYCTSLISITFGPEWDTSKVTDMSYMFNFCTSLTSLDLSFFNTSNVTNMSRMFQCCTSLTSITFGPDWDTSKVTNMSKLFDGCTKLTTLDLSFFDTSNVTNMSGMFTMYESSNMTVLDLSSFDFSKVQSYSNMFDSYLANCVIYVKDQTALTWLTSKFSFLTNVQIKAV